MSRTPDVIKKRRDFLACARGRRWSTPGFLLQARARDGSGVSGNAETDALRIGYTCSKKVGNAVTRNRAKRRLREIAREILPVHGQSGWDYVLVGFADTTVSRPFWKMLRDLETALERVHAPRKPKRRSG
ncbi:MAG: ribonuclease P protein component [Pseudomonadota bacterium]